MNHYELLEVSPSASASEIRAAYEKLRRLLGPDAIAVYSLVDAEEARTHWLAIEEAHAVLCNPATRRAYDRGLGIESEVPPSEAPSPSFEEAVAQIEASPREPEILELDEADVIEVLDEEATAAPSNELPPEPVASPAFEQSTGPLAPPILERSAGPAAPPVLEHSAGPAAPPILERSAGPAAPPVLERSAGPLAPLAAERSAEPAAPILERSRRPEPAPTVIERIQPLVREPDPFLDPAAREPNRVAEPAALETNRAVEPERAAEDSLQAEIAADPSIVRGPTPLRPGGEPAPSLPEGTEFTGALLRRLREGRGLSLEELCRRTRIKPSHLQHLEEERFAQLPERVFLRGILAAYARELRLDPARVCDSYLRRREDAQR